MFILQQNKTTLQSFIQSLYILQIGWIKINTGVVSWIKINTML